MKSEDLYIAERELKAIKSLELAIDELDKILDAPNPTPLWGYSVPQEAIWAVPVGELAEMVLPHALTKHMMLLNRLDKLGVKHKYERKK